MASDDSLSPHGWHSNFPEFEKASPRVIRARLSEFIIDANPQQVGAWDDSIPKLQTEVREVMTDEPDADLYTAILEYQLPLESRRADVILLVRGAVVVLELKGKTSASQADIDQAAAYSRDLSNYHRACSGRAVHAVVVPTAARGELGVRSGVHIVGPDALDRLVRRLQPPWPRDIVEAQAFLGYDAYRPLPTLVRAARELFASGALRRIERASANTAPAIDEVTRIIREAAATRSRRLVLVTGVPGSGKTLVGLRIVHAHFLDDLAIARAGERPSAPAVFLSGNGPLVEVLQYELRGAGGGGKTFVRGVKDYVKQYSRGTSRIPPEHVLVFDEAQRAWDRERVEEKHEQGGAAGRSEPEHFIEFASRIPDWCVVVGLIGSGQEINVGEEGGLIQWRQAIEGAPNPCEWQVHGPGDALNDFGGSAIRSETNSGLRLNVGVRYHLAKDVDALVECVLAGDSAGANALALRLDGTYSPRITRNLSIARKYLRDRYANDSEARFGLVASARDKDLVGFGIPNDFASTRIRYGPWYSDGDDGPYSCRHFRELVTEFGAQGLELDATLLAWGTDLIRVDGEWSTKRARGYKRGVHVRNPHQLRLNAYRVLLTRGRDGTVIFVPPLLELDDTADFLSACGFVSLENR
ncbi:MAG TPA: DNA/RNA helicase domain-containing protein [Candidatus Polarisedimenticolaceae bacterium]|nr:DNA/RNA helicase domain-containing protein [Candidatus Polarisedimenticolaceae bacterium]